MLDWYNFHQFFLFFSSKTLKKTNKVAIVSVVYDFFCLFQEEAVWSPFTQAS